MLANHFNKSNYRSLLITGMPLENEGDMSYLLDREPAETHIVPSLQRDINPLKDVCSLLGVMKILRDFKPHIVHSHTAKAGFVGRIASYALGIKNTIHTYHGHTFAHYFSPLKNRIFLNMGCLLI